MRLASFTKKISTAFMLWLSLATTIYASNSIDSVRIWPAPENTRIVFDLSEKADFKYFSLNSPQRLVIDFKNSVNKASLMSVINDDRRVKKFEPVRQKKKAVRAWY